MYVYSKQISTPMLTYKFCVPPNTLLVCKMEKPELDSRFDLIQNDGSNNSQDQNESTDFVSSVCWKKVLFYPLYLADIIFLLLFAAGRGYHFGC